MKKVSLFALIGLIAVITLTLIQDVWWTIFWNYIDSNGVLMSDKIYDEIPSWNTYIDICNYLELFTIVGWGAILFFFIYLYKNQTKDMKKSSLLAIIGLCLIILVILYYTFIANVVGYSSAVRVIINIIQMAGYALIVPFFVTLYKKSK